MDMGDKPILSVIITYETLLKIVGGEKGDDESACP